MTIHNQKIVFGLTLKCHCVYYKVPVTAVIIHYYLLIRLFVCLMTENPKSRTLESSNNLKTKRTFTLHLFDFGDWRLVCRMHNLSDLKTQDCSGRLYSDANCQIKERTVFMMIYVCEFF